MTEDQAKTKWCPMLGSQKRDHGPTFDGKDTNCIGSQCMAWRATDREAVPCQPDGEPDFKKAGYCGLVGRT